MWGSEAEGTLEASLCLVWLSRPGPCASARASQVGTIVYCGHRDPSYGHCWAGQAGHRGCAVPYQARLSWLESPRSRCEGSLPGIRGRWCQLLNSLLPAAADQVQVFIVQTPLEERGILARVGVAGVSSPDAEA